MVAPLVLGAGRLAAGLVKGAGLRIGKGAGLRIGATLFETRVIVRGFSNTQEKINRLSGNRFRALTPDMLERGASILKKHVDANVPRRTGNLARGIKFKIIEPRFGEAAAVKVYSTAPHSHLVQLGTVERFHQSGKSTGIMPENQFFPLALEAAENEMVRAMSLNLRKSLSVKSSFFSGLQ